MTALVTGATGFVGNAVARALVETGEKTRVLVRPETDRRLLLNLDVEIKTGDLRDYDSVVAATQGVQTVYHVAAMYKLWLEENVICMIVTFLEPSMYWKLPQRQKSRKWFTRVLLPH